MQDQDLDWRKCVWLCTDQAASIVVFVRVQPQNKKSCKQKSAFYTLHASL